MSGEVKHNTKDLTYEAVDANLAAGKVVIPSTTATESGLQGIKVAGDAAVNVVGVSASNCVTAANRAALENANEASPGAYPITSIGIDNATTAVYNDFFGQVTYTAVAVAYGVRICAAAAGAVRAWVSGTDPASAIIGFCAQPGGVGSGGGLALARIHV